MFQHPGYQSFDAIEVAQENKSGNPNINTLYKFYRHPKFTDSQGDNPTSTISVTSEGVITYNLRLGLRVHITLDKAMLIRDDRFNITLTISSSPARIAMIHPNGNVYRQEDCAEIFIYNNDKLYNNYYAKIQDKTVSFTNDSYNSIYTMQPNGEISWIQWSKKKNDYSINNIFTSKTRGSDFIDIANITARTTYYRVNNDFSETWKMNGITLTQKLDGTLYASIKDHNYGFACSPVTGYTSISSSNFCCVSEIDAYRSIFMEYNGCRTHYDSVLFNVTNKLKYVSLDQYQQLRIYKQDVAFHNQINQHENF